MANKISVSVMCSDLMNLERDIKTLERNGIDWLHIDVMDGHFVPNMTFGPDFPNAMHKVTNLPLDIHLMCEEPEFICSKIDVHQGDIVSTHVELDKDLSQFAADIHSKGALFGVVVNPDTPVEAVAPHMAYTDMVTLMLVHPGFSGAKLVDGVLKTAGGRVLGVTANGATLKEARANAYKATEWVQFENKYMRTDIGKAIDEA